jgi:hypothetical protein
MRLALTGALLALAATLAAFNAWQLVADPAAGARAQTAPPEPAPSQRSRQGPEWIPSPVRAPHDGPAPESLLKRPVTAPTARETASRGKAPARPRPEPPPAAERSTPSREAAPPERPHVPRVSAVLWSEERPLAVVDGRVVAPGETVAGLRVERIGRRVVYLVSEDGKAAVAAPLGAGSRESTP